MAAPRQSASQRTRGFGLLVSNLAKLAGVVVTLNETLLRTDLRPIALAVSALMIAGAQGLESVLDKLLGR
jgi:hypothetical protein